MNIPSPFCTDVSDRRIVSREGLIVGLEHLRAFAFSRQIDERDQTIQTLSGQIAERDEAIQTLLARLAECDQSVSIRVAERDQSLRVLSARLAEITGSKAWRMALLLRKIRLRLVPAKSWRARVCADLQILCFFRTGRSEEFGNRERMQSRSRTRAWSRKDRYAPSLPKSPPLQGAKSANLVNIENVVPCPAFARAHCRACPCVLPGPGCPNWPAVFSTCPFLTISLSRCRTRRLTTSAPASSAELPLCEKLKVEIVPNRGRDMAPLFCAFGKELMNYDFIAHLHSKKSRYSKGATLGWREYLCTSLFGSDRRIRQIFTLLTGENPAGIVYPQTYCNMPSWAHTWLANRQMGTTWCKRLGIDRVPRGYFDYPVGSMFWARADALRPLFAAGISWEDFPAEAGQLDGTLAHCLERLFVLVARQQGFQRRRHRGRESAELVGLATRSLFLADAASGRSVFRRPQAPRDRVRHLRHPVVPPAVGPGNDKGDCRTARREDVWATCIGSIGPRRRPSLASRPAATWHSTASTRSSPGRAGCRNKNPIRCEVWKKRWNGMRFLRGPMAYRCWRQPARAGKRVILVSDMFLPKDFLEALLKEHGIVDWDALYLSNDVGLRKDTGDLYRHILEREGLPPAQMLMVGDNERADVQIPVDMGMPTYHVLRPTEDRPSAAAIESFRGRPGARQGSEQPTDDGARWCDAPIRRCSIRRLNPASLFPPTPFALGYSIVGPLVLGFVHWLVEQARRDGMDRLYFLAREGQKLKLVYDRWAEALGGGPPSEYLVLSRRATTVPAINSHQDILNIARTHYAANTAKCFLDERFGLVLSEKRWDELYRHIGWSPSNRGGLERPDRKGCAAIAACRSGRHLCASRRGRPGLQAYLREMGFENTERTAIVDIGYSATVQDRVSLFTKKPVHGYYMMTVAQAHAVAIATEYCTGVFCRRRQRTVRMLHQIYIEKVGLARLT